MTHPNRSFFTSFVLTLVLSPLVAQAQVKQVSLRVDGLACPFCAYGLEKKVAKLEGYKADTYTVKINEGVVSFDWRRDKPLDLDAIERAVDKAGFTLRGVTGRFTGTLENGDDEQHLLRLLAPFDQRFVLQEPSRTGAGDPRQQSAPALQTPTNRLRERLESMSANGNAVEIVGRVHPRRDAQGPDSIEVGELKVLEPPAQSAGRFVFEVQGLRCGECVAKVVQALGPVDEVLHVQGDAEARRVVIWTESESPDLAALEQNVASLGFDVRRLSATDERSTRGAGE